jgi:hypothetical protein
MPMSLSEYRTNAEVEDRVGGLLLFGSLRFFPEPTRIARWTGDKEF